MHAETMNRTMVKLCGLRRPEDAQAADRLRPDLAGFILSPGFGRSIDLERAKELRRILSREIRTVGVFVNAPPEDILQAAEAGCINMIQLHGKEDDAYIRKINSLTGLPVIKAFRISERKDLEAAAASAARWVLLDSGGGGTGRRFDWDLLESFLQETAKAVEAAEDVEDAEGTENAETSIIAENPEAEAIVETTETADCPSTAKDVRPAENLFPGGHSWILAGGLSAENVSAAIGRFHPTAVDVSSRVETDGVKDPAKMAAFTAAARADQNV